MVAHPERARQVFDAALERPEPERGAFLAAACGDDLALRQHVERLVAAHAAAQVAFPEASGSERAGDLIGSYKLLEVIGEGGFGTVWMAEQQQPIRRKVALKVLKWGMDTRQVVARFEAERQALALMDHPHIAKVFEGGATATGRPYFAMELVRGVPITRYCDEAKLSLRARVELFVPVCEAVQHAHQKGVIHRDLKPSNVLVTLHDGRAVPKVIDFGIAKATAGQLTDKTVFTGFRQMLGTPEYMAPEQAEMSGLDVDTRADIYSLGVLLYELLTGTKPFELKDALAVGWHELIRRIKEVDPDKPSTRVSTLGERVTEIAMRRRMLPKGLSSAFRGDLDWIVLKALEKDRGRRYESVHGLAEDLARHLRDEPVLAGPPSRRYRLGKYLRRHRVGVTAVAAVVLSLVVGAVASGLGYFEAKRQAGLAGLAASDADAARIAAERARGDAEQQRTLAERREGEAKRQAEKALRLATLLRSMLSSSNPHEKKGQDYRVRELLADFEREVGAQLQAEPEVEATLRATLGTTYLGLGLPRQAAPHLERSLALHETLHGAGSPDYAVALADLALLRHDQGLYVEALELSQRAADIATAVGDARRLDLARYLQQQADSLRHLGRGGRAEELGREALKLQIDLRGERDPETAGTRLELARVLSFQGQPAGAEAMCRQALADLVTVRGEADLDVASARLDLADLLTELGRLGEAEVESVQALAVRRQLLPEPHSRIAAAQQQLAALRAAQGRFREAEDLHRGALRMAEQTLGEDHPSFADHLMGLGETLRLAGDLGEAEATLRRVLALQTEAYGEQHFALATTLSTLGLVVGERGDYAQAERIQRRALQMRQALFGAEDASVATSLNNLAIALAGQDNLEEAEDRQRQALAMHQALHGAVHPSVAISLSNLGDLLLRRGRRDQALEAHQQARAMYETMFGKEHPSVGLSKGRLARVRLEQGYPAEAEGLLRDALEVAMARLGDGHPDVASLRCDLATSLVALTRYDEAVAEFDRALALRRQAYGDDHDSVAVTRLDFGGLLLGLGKLDQAEQIYRELLARPADQIRLAPTNRLAARNNLATVLWKKRDYLAAEGQFREVLAELESLVGEHHPNYATVLDNLGVVLEAQGKVVDAERALRRALALRHQIGDAFLVSTSQNSLGMLLLNQGKAADAEPLFREALQGLTARLAATHPNVTTCRSNLGLALVRLGKAADAEPCFRQALADDRQALGAKSPKDASTLCGLAGALEAQGKPDEAQASLEEGVALLRAAGSAYRRQLAEETVCLARLLERRGELARAEPLLAESAELWLQTGSEQDPNVRDSLLRHGDALRRLGRLDGAEARYRRALALAQAAPAAAEELELRLTLVLVERGDLAAAEALVRAHSDRRLARLGPEHRELAATHTLLGRVLLLAGKAGEAEPRLRESLRLRAANPPDSWQRFYTMALLGAALHVQGRNDEAEPLLRDGYQGMLQSASSAPSRAEIVRWLVRWCEATLRTEEATVWRDKLPASDEKAAGRDR